MVALYVISSEKAAGKTAVCAGLGKYLLGAGKKVGFFKPITADGNQPPAEGVDSDATFMKHILALTEPIDSLCPVISGEGNLADKIKPAYARISVGKDVVLIESTGEPSLDRAYEIAEALDARVVVVESYSKELPKAKSIDRYKDFGKHLLGVVLNKVPGSQMESVRSQASAKFGKAGINVIGVLPEDRALFTLTIGELAEHISGNILNSAEKSAELVDDFMLGAMSVDPGPVYFGRKDNKAVIVKGSRTDMQLAALETSVSCFVLTGDTAPTPAVLYGAENKKIPIILTTDDVSTTVTNIGRALGRTRFNQEKKLPRLAEIMEQHFNFQALYSELDLAG